MKFECKRESLHVTSGLLGASDIDPPLIGPSCNGISSLPLSAILAVIAGNTTAGFTNTRLFPVALLTSFSSIQGGHQTNEQ